MAEHTHFFQRIEPDRTNSNVVNNEGWRQPNGSKFIISVPLQIKELLFHSHQMRIPNGTFLARVL